MRLWLYIGLSLILLCSCAKEVDPIIPSSGDIKQEGSYVNSRYLYHNRWTYSQMKEWYLWTDEIPDSTELDFTVDPLKFFESLLSEKDRFSYMDMNPDYRGSRSLCDGLDYQMYKDASGSLIYRVLRVIDPSLRILWARGDWFVIRDGQPVRGEVIEGVFEEDRSCLRPSRRYSDSFVDTLYHINGKAVGYVLYDNFELYVTFARAVHSFREKGGVDELILDLRYNPGGYVDVCRKVSSLIVPRQYLGSLFQIHEHNDVKNQANAQKQGGGLGLDSLYFQADVRTNEINLGLERLYVLTTKHTASASEALIHCLRPYMDVITVGSVSCGKNVGGHTIESEGYRYTLHPITFRYMNAEGFLFSSEGIEPDIYAEDDLDHKLGDVNEGMLSAALAHISGDDIPSDGLGRSRRRWNGFPVEYGKSSIEFKNNL